MLELKDITKEYRTGDEVVHALKGVSVRFRESEFVAILGQSGCGKTTLLNIVGGLDQYTSGDLVINGVSTKEYKDKDWDAYRNHSVGFVFQSYNLIPHQTVLSNVELALTLSGVSKAERRKRAMEALQAVGLGDQLHKKPSQMSGGQMQRVAIARALVNDPDIILADEPTGALDTATSVQVMDILSVVAKNRLVVMVTHNPELAEQYATRIVRLLDGVIQTDSNPPTDEELAADVAARKVQARTAVAQQPLNSLSAASPADGSSSASAQATEPLAASARPADAGPSTSPASPDAGRGAAPSGRKSGKTRMGFFTALSLSLNNLMTKKGRTLLTAFAGSIGIIGIAAILALANGVNDYIASVEENTLSEYPLTIEDQGFDMASLVTSSMTATDDSGESADEGDASEGSADGTDDTAADEKPVHEVKMIASMFGSIGSNDLASLKSYLDSPESGIDQYTNAIEYTYNVTPQVFSADTSNGVRQVNPDSSFSALGLGAGVSTNSIMSSMMNTNVFYEMPADTTLVEDQYDVKAGRWPENYNECVLVLTSTGGVSDFMLYTMGLRDADELTEMVKEFANEEEVVVPEDRLDFSYEDLMNVSFKLVNAADYYQHDDAYNVWVDKSSDETYMKNLVNEGEDLHIVGVVQQKPETNIASLTTGIYYTPQLITHLVEEASQTQVVQDQLADPAVNVFTGKSFVEEENEQDSSFDMESLFTIDGEKIQAAFTIDQSKLQMDLSGLKLDTSALNFNAASLPAFDASSINVSPSIDLNQLNLDFSDLSISLDGAEGLNPADMVKPEALSSAMASVIEGFFPWWQAGGAQTTDVQQAFAAYMETPEVQQQLSTAIAGSIDLSGMQESIQTAVQEQLAPQIQAKIAEQLVPALQQSISTSLQSSLTTALQSYMQTALTQAMSQVTSQLEAQITAAMKQSMSQLSANMASALSIDESAFADAFQMNMDEEELTELMMSLMTTEESSYAGNLQQLGYADFDEPSSIDIYPVDFESKERIIEILDGYNQRMEDEGQEDKVVTYTDIVGALMSSVTDIVNMISYVLMAFVAISLVVSSIMIGVITYISVLERNKEIGILRAIGASKGDIARVFNAETLIVGFVAGMLGVGVTAIACIPANAIVYSMFDVPNVAQLPWGAAIVLVVISMALTFVAGLLPSSIASRKDPVVALRSE